MSLSEMFSTQHLENKKEDKTMAHAYKPAPYKPALPMTIMHGETGIALLDAHGGNTHVVVCGEVDDLTRELLRMIVAARVASDLIRIVNTDNHVQSAYERLQTAQAAMMDVDASNPIFARLLSNLNRTMRSVVKAQRQHAQALDWLNNTLIDLSEEFSKLFGAKFHLEFATSWGEMYIQVTMF